MNLDEAHKKWLEALWNQKLEKLETTLLTEFHKWASPHRTPHSEPRPGNPRHRP